MYPCWLSMMHVCFLDACIHDALHMSMILDPDAYVHDARIYVACIYDPQSLTLMHVCLMHIPMILDPDSCVYDTYIHDP